MQNNKLILVDEQDNPIGYEEKEKCHNGKGLLHRAFSLFVFDREGQLLIQKRSKYKRLWSDYWSNSCCSHPKKGETLEKAAQRRLIEECGIHPYNGLNPLYKFQYHARFKNKGSEKELCHVLIGLSNTMACSDYSEPIYINSQEISEVRWVSKEWLLEDMIKRPEIYTPWFKLEAKEIFSNYLDEIDKLYSCFVKNKKEVKNRSLSPLPAEAGN